MYLKPYHNIDKNMVSFYCVKNLRRDVSMTKNWHRQYEYQLQKWKENKVCQVFEKWIFLALQTFLRTINAVLLVKWNQSFVRSFNMFLELHLICTQHRKTISFFSTSVTLHDPLTVNNFICVASSKL
jgi:hypothetical protein